MEIYLIRHGESVGNTKQGFISGRLDKGGLTTKGKSQILRLNWELKGTEVGRIITSPVQRTKDTAKLIQNAFPSPIVQRQTITELHHGVFEGKYWWEIIRSQPDFDWRKMQTDINYSYPEGESLGDVRVRVEKFYQWLISQKDKKPIFIISHQLVLSTILYVAQFGFRSMNKLVSSEESYLSYIHNKRVPHGLVAKLQIENGIAQYIKEFEMLEPLKTNEKTVLFYINGHLDSKSILNRIKTGSENKVYKKTNNTKVIIKILSDTQTVRSKRLIELYSYLKNNEVVQIPHTLFYDSSKVFFNNSCIMQEFIAGYELSRQLKNIGLLKQILEFVHDSIRKIHSVPASDVLHFWYPDDWKERIKTDWKHYMSVEIEKTVKATVRMKNYRTIKYHLLDLLDYIQKQKAQYVPLHGDFNSSNILIGLDKRVILLDFERARLGDPLWDLVYLEGDLSLHSYEGSKLWNQLYFKYLTESEQKKAFQYFILFHAWTVRDMIDYQGDVLRKNEGTTSQHILQSLVY